MGLSLRCYPMRAETGVLRERRDVAELDMVQKPTTDELFDLLISRAAAPFDSLLLGGTVTECELIVKESEGGVARGWVREAGGLFRNDVNTTVADATLRTFATSSGPLTYTCAPPGSGARMGIDRDEDTVLDGLDNCPDLANGGKANFDGDALGDDCDPDDDNDGLLDEVETNTGTFVDADNTGTDPFDADSDGDGFSDGEKRRRASDRLGGVSATSAHSPRRISIAKRRNGMCDVSVVLNSTT